MTYRKTHMYSNVEFCACVRQRFRSW